MLLNITHKIFHTFLILTLTQLTLFYDNACGEIVIIHRLKKTVAFNITNDIEIERRFGIGENGKQYNKKGYLAVADPLDACSPPKKPPNITKNIYSSGTGLAATPNPTVVPQAQWVALITGGGGCDLRTKVIHTSQAGYTRVIVKITHPDDVSGYNDLHHNNDVEIDISLVNPHDWDTIKKYVHPKPYFILFSPPAAPVASTTVSEKTFFVFSTLERILDGVFYIVNIPNTLVTVAEEFIFRCFKELLISPLNLDRMSASEIAYSFGCFIVPGLMLLTPLVYGWLRSDARDDNLRNENSHRNDNARARRNENAVQNARIRTCRDLLNLGVRGPLTQQTIERAYRREAPRFHPDMNQGRNAAELAERTAHFRRLTEARDFLLEIFS